MLPHFYCKENSYQSTWARHSNLFADFVLNRYGGLTVGNIQKSIPASFGRKIPPMVRKIAVRRSAQVKRALWTRQEVHRYSINHHWQWVTACAQVLYNNKGYHSMPTYLNVLNNAILRANLPSSKGNPAAYGNYIWYNMDSFAQSSGLGFIIYINEVVLCVCVCVCVLQVSHWQTTQWIEPVPASLWTTCKLLSWTDI